MDHLSPEAIARNTDAYLREIFQRDLHLGESEVDGGFAHSPFSCASTGFPRSAYSRYFVDPDMHGCRINLRKELKE